MSRVYSKYFYVRPQDLNHGGTLFGGVMMSLADEMAFVAASLTFRDCTFVTKLFREFNFISGAVEGDIIYVEAELLSKGRSSVRVSVKGSHAANGTEIFQTEAILVNAVRGQSVPIPDEAPL
jgi:acyl-CoA hydrolase